MEAIVGCSQRCCSPWLTIGTTLEAMAMESVSTSMPKARKMHDHRRCQALISSSRWGSTWTHSCCMLIVEGNSATCSNFRCRSQSTASACLGRWSTSKVARSSSLFLGSLEWRRDGPTGPTQHAKRPVVVTAAAAKVVVNDPVDDRVIPPASEEECIQQAATSLSLALGKSQGAAVGMAKATRRQKQGTRARQSRLLVQIPVADDSPSTLARLVEELVSALRKERGDGLLGPVELRFGEPAAAAIGIAAVDRDGRTGAHLRPSDLSSGASATVSQDSSVVIFVSPREEQVSTIQLICNSAGSRPVIILNPCWPDDVDLPPGARGFVASFDTVYSFTPLAIQGLFSKSEGAVLKYFTGGPIGATPWIIYSKEGGKFQIKTQLKKAPSPEELEKIMYNVAAANSPLTKSVKFFKSIVSKDTTKK